MTGDDVAKTALRIEGYLQLVADEPFFPSKLREESGAAAAALRDLAANPSECDTIAKAATAASTVMGMVVEWLRSKFPSAANAVMAI